MHSLSDDEFQSEAVERLADLVDQPFHDVRHERDPAGDTDAFLMAGDGRDGRRARFHA